MPQSPILPAQLLPALVAISLVAQDAKAPLQRLSLQEAIETALKNNLQVQIASETRKFTQASVLSELGTFDWTLNSSLSLSKTKSERTDQFVPGAPIQTTDTNVTSRNLSVGTVKPFVWGGTLQLNYGTQSSPISYISRDQSLNEGPFLNVTPFPYGGSFSATYIQSLLKNFGREATESRLIVARKSAQAADFTFQKSIIDLVANTESLYWDVVFAQRNLENKKQSLALAQKQLRDNQIRVQVGTMAPIEVTSAEAAAAQREQEIISAEAQLFNAQDALLRALYPTVKRPAGLELSDSPSITPMAMEEAMAEKMALEQRVELKSARLDVESKKIQETAANNRLKPQLDLSLSYIANAATRESYSKVNSDITGAKFPGYSVGLTFSLPIANHAAKGTQAQARANLRSSELTFRDLELGITLEVRQANRNVAASEKGVRAAEKTRIFREKNLEAEQKKFENGMSTNFFVLQRQDELDLARSSELQAQISYAKAVTALEKALGRLLETRKLEVR